jgi:hypothetical protein
MVDQVLMVLAQSMVVVVVAEAVVVDQELVEMVGQEGSMAVAVVVEGQVLLVGEEEMAVLGTLPSSQYING